MAFEAEVGLNNGFVYVVLENKEAVEAAIRELDGTALFSRRVFMRPVQELSKVRLQEFPHLNWGWWASDSNNYRHVKTLGVRLEPAKDIFLPRREGRTLSMLTSADALEPKGVYSLLHKYNVECLSKEVKFHHGGTKRQESTTQITFATREEADAVMHGLDGFVWKGIKLCLRRWQLSRKHLGVTWSSGRPGEHFLGLRDQESAVSTNFEYARACFSPKAMLIRVSRY